MFGSHDRWSDEECVCFQDYISEFKFQSVVAQDLIDFFLGYFPDLKDAAVAQREGETIILVFLKCMYMWSRNRTSHVTCCVLCKSRLVSTVACYICSLCIDGTVWYHFLWFRVGVWALAKWLWTAYVWAGSVSRCRSDPACGGTMWAVAAQRCPWSVCRVQIWPVGMEHIPDCHVPRPHARSVPTLSWYDPTLVPLFSFLL